jgi:hypothetical protein
MGDTHNGKRKLEVDPRKKKGKKQKRMNELMLGSEESILSPDE